jgi:glyoxylase I family protein
MLDEKINQIIKQEIQLLDRVDAPDVLAELIDNEFIEIGSSASIYDKAEVMRWLASDVHSERIGTSFKAHPLAENIILLTYISSIKDISSTNIKRAMRSSIWRLSEGRWRMVFHQGTPLTS